MQVHTDIDAFLSFYNQQPGPKRLIGYSKFARTHYAKEGLYGPGTWLLFGSEVSGLPPEVLVVVGLHVVMQCWARVGRGGLGCPCSSSGYGTCIFCEMAPRGSLLTNTSPTQVSSKTPIPHTHTPRSQATAAIDADPKASALVKIPMQQRHVRSLNLATSVGIGLYEALRQLDGPVLPDVDNF